MSVKKLDEDFNKFNQKRVKNLKKIKTKKNVLKLPSITQRHSVK